MNERQNVKTRLSPYVKTVKSILFYRHYDFKTYSFSSIETALLSNKARGSY